MSAYALFPFSLFSLTKNARKVIGENGVILMCNGFLRLCADMLVFSKKMLMKKKAGIHISICILRTLARLKLIGMEIYSSALNFCQEN